MAESYVTSLMLLDENKILADLNSIAIEMGLINNVFETSRIYVYYAVFARVLGNVTKIIAQYLNDIDIEETNDEALLEKLIKPFIKKRDARVAKVILEFTRRDGYAEESNDIFIPREFEVMTEGDDPIIFRTAESRVLWKDSYRVLIPAYSVEFGSLYNVLPHTLTYFDDESTYFFKELAVTNPYEAYGGRDEETAFDTRNRIDLFRYGRDGSKEFLQELLLDNGVSYYGYNLVEFWDGFGSTLIALDVEEEEYYDIVQNLESQRRDGIKYYYCRVNKVPANMHVTVKVTGDNMYTAYQADEIEQHVFTSTQLYFDNQMYVGKKLSKNRLEAFILQYLVDERYDIYEIDLEVEPTSDVQIDEETGQILVNDFERLVANKIYTKIEYNI